MSSVLSGLFIVSVLSAAVISAVALARALFKNSIGIKAISLLWALVLFRLLLPVTLQSPVYIGDVFPEKQNDNSYLAHEQTQNNTEYENNGTAEAEIIPVINPAAEAAEYITEETETVSTTSPKFAKWRAHIQKIDFSAALAALWAAVGIGILANGIFTLARFNSRLRGENIVSKCLYDAYQSARQRINIPFDVRIMESTHVDMPITYGLINPRIVIPKKMAEEIDSGRLQLIIMHELMHIKRLDILKNYLWLLAKAMHWFNPIVWIGYRMYLSDMEIVCDTKVMQKIQPDDRAEYSNSLVEAAKILGRTKQKAYPVVLNFCENKSKLRRRIMNILHPAKQKKSTSFAITILIISLLAMCFTTACLKPADENTADTVIKEDDQDILENDTNLNDDIMEFFVSAAASDEMVLSKHEEQRTIGDVEVRVFLQSDLLYRCYLPQKDTFQTAKIEYMDLDDDFLQNTADYFLNGTYLDMNATQEYDLQKYVTLNHADKSGDLILRAYDKDKQEITLEMWSNKFGTGIYYARGELATARQSIIGEHSVHKAEIDKFIMASYINKAYEQAKTAVDDLNSQMELVNIYAGKFVPVGSELIYSEYDLYAQSDDISLTFLFTPKSEGVSSLLGQMSMDADQRYDVFDYIEASSDEFMMITIDKDGIACFVWQNMRDKESEATEEVQIISMEDAADIFMENVFDENKEWQPDPSSMVIITTDYAYLANYPVAEADGEYTQYPVYVFSGLQTSGLDQVNYTMIINAVDGSVIYQN